MIEIIVICICAFLLLWIRKLQVEIKELEGTPDTKEEIVSAEEILHILNITKSQGPQIIEWVRRETEPDTEIFIREDGSEIKIKAKDQSEGDTDDGEHSDSHS